MKKLISMLLVVVMVLALTACGNAEEASGGDGKTITLKLSHMRPEGAPEDEAIKEFAAEVEEGTDGAVKFEIYPAEQLGDYNTVMERISVGDIDAQVASLGAALDKNLNLPYLCYLISSWEEAEEIFNNDEGVLLDIIKEILSKYNIEYLGVYPSYFGGIALTEMNFDPHDLSAKPGIEIRTPVADHFSMLAENMGYIPTPLASSETFTALQTGMVKGACGMGAEGYYSNYRDLIKYYLASNTHFDIHFFVMSSQSWNKLSEEQQKVVSEAAQNMQKKRFEVAPGETEEYEQKLKDEGVEVINYSEEEITQMSDSYRENVWPKMKEQFDEGIMDKIIDAYDL